MVLQTKKTFPKSRKSEKNHSTKMSNYFPLFSLIFPFRFNYNWQDKTRQGKTSDDGDFACRNIFQVFERKLVYHTDWSFYLSSYSILKWRHALLRKSEITHKFPLIIVGLPGGIYWVFYWVSIIAWLSDV